MGLRVGGWGLGTETGKGKRGWVPVFGLDAVASHPWSGGCPIMSVSTMAFRAPKNDSLSPE